MLGVAANVAGLVGCVGWRVFGDGDVGRVEE
jgi:hypothetical protein